MISSVAVPFQTLMFSAYVLAFVLATAACLGAACRARSVTDPETRRALTWFFLSSAGWAGAYVGFLLVGSTFGKHLFYQLSLIVGFGTVFAWLWFCSAYSGRGLHRRLEVQQLAAVVYGVVTVLKVTNPLHGLYYGLEPVGGAFGHVITHETLYWVVMALAYALSAVGYLMIFELLLKAEANVFPLAVLTGLTALPAVLNVIGHTWPALLDITHEPLGVAVFAMGLLFLYETQFRVVHRVASVEDPNLTIGREGRIQGLGGGIAEIVPPLSEEALGAPIAEVLPGLAKTIQATESTWTATFEGELRHYRVVQVRPGEVENTQTVILSDITERQERKRELQKNERRFQAMLNDPNILAGVLAPDGTLLQVNDTAMKYIEATSREAVLGRPFWETPWWEDEDRPVIRRKIDKADGGEYVGFEAEHVAPSGKPHTVTGAIRPVSNKAGEIVSLFVTARDVTERERRGRRLERQNDLFMKAQDLADVGAWAYDVSQDRLVWSEQVYRIHGVSKDIDLTPETAIGLYHPEDRPRIKEAFVQAVEEGTPYDEELRIQRPDGTVRWVRAYGEPQAGPGEDTVRVRGAFQDITEQRRREDTLRKLRQTYQGVLEGAPNAIFVAEAGSGKITEANQAAASLIGVPTDEIIGRDQSALHPDGEASKYRSLFKQAMQDAENRSRSFSRLEDGSQTFVETASGERVPVEISATLVDLGDDQTGEKVFVGIFRDITERKRKTQQLKHAKRQAELSKREAEEASRMKSAMLANMSHEIRTPLTSIIGFAEAIGDEMGVDGSDKMDSEGATGGQVARFSGLIEDSGRRLLDTLDTVLNLSKLEAGQMTLAADPVNLAEQARQVAGEFEAQVEECGLTLEVETQKARAQADEGGLKIILQNLLSNAIKYTEEGSIEVRTYREETEAVLEVADTGIGMDPEVAEGLFDPFRQASEGLSREYEGTGVGLAVTKKATEKMGGSISVDTQKGEGSRFAVRLPAAEDKTDQEKSTAKDETGEILHTGSGDGERGITNGNERMEIADLPD